MRREGRSAPPPALPPPVRLAGRGLNCGRAARAAALWSIAPTGALPSSPLLLTRRPTCALRPARVCPDVCPSWMPVLLLSRHQPRAATICGEAQRRPRLVAPSAGRRRCRGAPSCNLRRRRRQRHGAPTRGGAGNPSASNREQEAKCAHQAKQPAGASQASCGMREARARAPSVRVLSAAPSCHGFQCQHHQA